MGPGEIPQHLGGGSHVLVDEGDRSGSDEQLEDRTVTGLSRGTTHQRVLVDLVLSPGDSQRPPQSSEITDLESAVVGENGAARTLEMVTDLLNRGDLFWSWAGHLLSLRPLVGPDAVNSERSATKVKPFELRLVRRA